MATNRTVTVKSSDGDYSSLSAAEAGEQGNLVILDRQLTIECYSMSDTSQVTFNGWTTDTTRYVLVTVPAAERHDGKWNTSKYRLETTSAGNLEYSLTSLIGHLHLEGMQISTTPSNNSRSGAVHIYTGASYARIAACVLRQVGPAGSYSSGIQVWNNSANVDVINVIAYDFTNSSSAGFVNWGGGTLSCYNCTSAGCYNAYERGSGSVALANCIGANSTSGFSSGTVTATYCASTGSVPFGTGNRSNQTFTFADAANKDYHLQATDAGAKGYGVSDPGSGLFSDDIDGQARSGSWDIGADQYVAPGQNNRRRVNVTAALGFFKEFTNA